MRKLKQGNSYLFEILLLNYNSKPKDDIEIHSVNYVLSDFSNNPINYIQKDLSSPDIEILDEEGKIITIRINNMDTKDLPPGVLYHEAILCDPLGNISTLISEKVEIVDVLLEEC